MTPDHEKARLWAKGVIIGPEDFKPNRRNAAACYLDAMARLDRAEKECGDLLGRARDMLCDGWTEIEMAAWLSDYRAFLERKTDDKQS